MIEFLKKFVTNEDAFRQTIRALAVGLIGFVATPQGQAVLTSLGGWAAAIPIVAGLLGGAIPVGQKNR